MKTYQVRINEKSPLGKSIIALLQSAKEAVPSFVIQEKKKKVETYEDVLNKSPLHRELDHAFAEVRLMLDGKKKEKTLDELIHELQNSND